MNVLRVPLQGSTNSVIKKFALHHIFKKWIPFFQNDHKIVNNYVFPCYSNCAVTLVIRMVRVSGKLLIHFEM